jgi:hypothetical protein
MKFNYSIIKKMQVLIKKMIYDQTLQSVEIVEVFQILLPPKRLTN